MASKPRRNAWPRIKDDDARRAAAHADKHRLFPVKKAVSGWPSFK